MKLMQEVIFMSQPVSSHFQQVIESVEALPPDDQLLLIEIIRQHLIQYRRAELAAEAAEARQSYQEQAHPSTASLVYRTEATVSNDGTLSIAGLPFQAGDRVQVTVRNRLREPKSDQRYPLRGKRIHYVDPFESVAETVARW
jgi:hypothetical protein